MQKTLAFLLLCLLTLSYACSVGPSQELKKEQTERAQSATEEATTSSPSQTTTPKQRPTATPTQKPVKMVKVKTTDFQAGTTVLIYEKDPTDFGDKVEKLLDRLVDDNVNSISLVFPFMQDTWYSSSVKKYDATLSDEDISSFIKRAHARGFSVLLRPIMDESSLTSKDISPCGNNSPDAFRWRGSIVPCDNNAWFKSYTDLIVSYAKIAQAENTEIFSIGVELNSLIGTKYVPQWNELISQVKSVYSGKLIYSTNHDFPDDTGFWDKVDYVGIDAFYALDVPLHPTEQQLVDAWGYATDYIKKASVSYGKPVILTEIGVRAEEGGFLHPWYWENNTPIDLQAQRLFYSAACTATKGIVGGYYFWYTSLYIPEHPETDPNFEFAHKPAEQALAECYANTP